MAHQRRRRNVVACGNCGANYDARGEDPRCPACDARLAEYEPGVPRPALRGYTVTDLEGPDNLRSAQEPETAPIEDFIAAALVLLSFVVMVTAVMSRSPALLQIGMAIFAVTGIGFGLIKLRKFLKYGRQRPKGSFDEAPSMFDWLIGRGFWDRFR